MKRNVDSQEEKGGGLRRVGDIAEGLLADIFPVVEPARPLKKVSKRVQKRVEGIERIRLERAEEKQKLGYLARPFILCGLPFKPQKDQSTYKRVNGNEVLEIIASPDYGLPYGADMQVLVWVSTLAVLQMKENEGKCPRVIKFRSGADFLKAFDLPLDGASYKRARDRFLRIFYSTFYWGEKGGKRERMMRVHFFDQIDLWFSKDINTDTLPGNEFENKIVLSEAFAADLERHHPPIEIAAVATWSDKPAQLYFYLWLVFRCYLAEARSEIPLMGRSSVFEQCGGQGYEGESGERNWTKKVTKWLDGVHAAWPQCPAKIDIGRSGRKCLIIEGHAQAIHDRKPKQLGA
jgi:Plasmid encoded RepA protein